MNPTRKSVASLVFGIISLVIAVIMLFVPFPFIGIIPLILGIIAVSLAVQSNKIHVPANGGLVTGILGVVFSSLSLACWLALIGFVGCISALTA